MTEAQQANVDLVMTFFNAFIDGDDRTAMATMSKDFKATFFNPSGVKKETERRQCRVGAVGVAFGGTTRTG